MKRYELRASSCKLKPEFKDGLVSRPRLLRNRGARRGVRGFTILEMTVVIIIMMLLMAIAIPWYEHHITHTREAVFLENLHTLNRLIDQYSLDKKQAPQSLDDLVQSGYLKYIPNDITGKSDTWKTDPEDPQNCTNANQCGIGGVHSGSDASGSDGRAYSSWQ